MVKTLLSPFLIMLRSLRSAFCARSNLVIENLALRQQVALLKKENPRPRLSLWDRLFWVCLRRVWGTWSQGRVIVRPETVIPWGQKTPGAGSASNPQFLSGILKLSSSRTQPEGVPLPT